MKLLCLTEQADVTAIGNRITSAHPKNKVPSLRLANFLGLHYYGLRHLYAYISSTAAASS